ncbi:hypothetical protein [Pseudonocardia lacus]|uniref:hypothetical protein n=1 Tax=Pseudonocardia lacus TaxID=2835865 RepID=UPI001BDCDDE6|nr:hypothetical protein [Pseudonocardia lacus]
MPGPGRRRPFHRWRPPVVGVREVDASPPDPLAVAVDADLLDSVLDFPLDALVAGAPPAGGSAEVLADLADWRARVDARPVPDLVDLDAAVAVVLGALRSRHERDLRAVRSSHVLPRGGSVSRR